MKSARLLAALFVTVLLASGATPAKGADAMVVTNAITFSPSSVTIAPGEKVTFTNADAGFHNVRFDDGMFECPADPATVWPTCERTFAQAGDYTYFCEQHSPGMSGTVHVVQPPTSCAVPNVRKLKTGAAKTALAIAGCTSGALKKRFSQRVKRGRVISHSPGAGAVLPLSAPVNLVVSKGPR